MLRIESDDDGDSNRHGHENQPDSECRQRILRLGDLSTCHSLHSIADGINDKGGQPETALV